VCHDVIIAGLGPVGLLLANLLGARGVSVLAVDPAPGPSRKPRAATTDDGVLRILQGVGLIEALEPHLAIQPRVSFVAADGRILTLLETASGSNGHPPLVGWHQPGAEAAMLGGLARFPSVRARWGAGIARLHQDGASVRAALSDGTEAEGTWLVGCDGAASPVRRLSGMGFEGSTFVQRWRVIDVQIQSSPSPHAHVHFIGDPRRPAVSLPTAPGRHRWEFQGAAPAGVDGLIEREAVYEFHARMADSWRQGRVLLAGDAAHVMPPFGGQGLAAGMRDAANLAWKLDAVLHGAPPRLLDTYEAERRREVGAATRLARVWGAVLQTRRPRLARTRDAVMFTIDPTPAGRWLRARARPQPRIRRGVVVGSSRSGAGELFPQPDVEVAGRRHALDDVLGPGWSVLGRLEESDAAAWRALGARVPDDLHDVDGVIGAWLAGHRATWVALRPDRIVFAAGGRGESARAADAARAWIAAP
jgi:3-(3-hydroxy-phenyl)propionate hydroxylase